MNRKLSWSSWTFCTRQLSSLMAVAVKTAMTLKSYQNQAGLLVKDYLLSDPFVPYTSILGGILACKVVVPILCWNILEAWGNHSFVMMILLLVILVFFSFKCLIFSLSLFSMKVYDLTQLISAFYFRSYNSLTKMQRIEWNNRWTHFHFYIFILLVFCWLECFFMFSSYYWSCRGLSTFHAIFITSMSLYFVFWSDIFSNQHLPGVFTRRSSLLSTSTLGVSILLSLLLTLRKEFFSVLPRSRN